MYLVDANVLSEARRGSVEALSWLRSIDPLLVFLSVVTLGEIARGIAMKQKRDPTAAAHLADWLGRLRHDHADRNNPARD